MIVVGVILIVAATVSLAAWLVAFCRAGWSTPTPSPPPGRDAVEPATGGSGCHPSQAPAPHPDLICDQRFAPATIPAAEFERRWRAACDLMRLTPLDVTTDWVHVDPD